MMRRSVLFPVLLVTFLGTLLHIANNYLIANGEFSHSYWIHIYEKNGWSFNNILNLYYKIYTYQWWSLLIILLFTIDMLRRKNTPVIYFSWFISIVVFVNILWFIFTIITYYGVYTSFYSGPVANI